MTRQQAEALRDIARAQVQRINPKPVEWAVWCLCNHTAKDHGMLDYEAVGTVRAKCVLCDCVTFQEDPLTSPFADTDFRPGSLREDI